MLVKSSYIPTYDVFVFSFSQICSDILKELLVHDGHVVKEKFVKAYVEVSNTSVTDFLSMLLLEDCIL